MIKIKNAFTLLELLVVIGIIGILVALATVSYSATQKSGRDSRRKQDLVGIQNALEQYYSDPAHSYTYPTGSCKAAVSYMNSAWPVDPFTNADYPIGVSACSSSAYCICAEMEKGTAGTYFGPNCVGIDPAKAYYCVGNLQ